LSHDRVFRSTMTYCRGFLNGNWRAWLRGYLVCGMYITHVTHSKFALWTCWQKLSETGLGVCVASERKIYIFSQP
jgi:hypothetical protein